MRIYCIIVSLILSLHFAWENINTNKESLNKNEEEFKEISAFTDEEYISKSLKYVNIFLVLFYTSYYLFLIILLYNYILLKLLFIGLIIDEVYHGFKFHGMKTNDFDNGHLSIDLTDRIENGFYLFLNIFIFLTLAFNPFSFVIR